MSNFQKIIENNSPALIDPRDFQIILEEMEKVNPKVILEIGTRQGYSSRAFYEAFHPELLITVDILTEDQMPGGIQKVHGGSSVHYIVGDSTKMETVEYVQKLLKDKKVDVLFIDGSHMFIDVLEDWINYKQFVREGGLIILHDVVEKRIDLEVWKLWLDIQDRYNTRTIDQHEGINAAGVGFVYV